ncbi:MAG TPA: LPS-assembly protein LptD, partial [Pinirhizobacter sp.]|nr:LPS-assembly protein LptD [Pinirhizobacter sp.]
RLFTDGIINFGYRYRRQNPQDNFAYIEQFDTSAVYPISDRWRVLGRWVWSRRDERTLEALAGVEYENCCMKLRLLGRHYVSSINNTVIGPILGPATTRNSVMFEVEFKGLGTTSPQIDTLLHRDILGYQ